MSTSHKPEASGVLPRIRRFLRRPWPEKANSLRYRWGSFLSEIPVPVRLPSGAWWIRRNDHVGESLLAGTFETQELAFAERFLQPGMTVLDIGAHHGLYSLLASMKIGRTGRVFSFEPSPRERRRLRIHLALNLCSNVTVQAMALGSEATESDLFVVQGSQTGCNSLRPPVVGSGTSPVRVQVRTLDAWLQRAKIQSVNFIKLDVEGAELSVLKGAAKLLDNRPRPLILAEVQDIRTVPWGYPAKDILNHLQAKGYMWFRLLPDGSLGVLDLSPQEFDGNFVACPQESTAALRGLISRTPSAL
jgi:FkbM family methyltransferase